MSIIPIKVYGNKILSQKTKAVKTVDDALIEKIRNMFDTLRNAKGIGLAANQVGYHESLFVLDLGGTEGYEKFKPLVMINPKIILESDEKSLIEEGCLSLPNVRAEVERAAMIKVRYLDTDEKENEIEANELFARVILHEYDHLIGKMIPDRVAEDTKKKIQNELIKISSGEFEIDYPVAED